MEPTKQQPGNQTTGKPSDNNTDVNQQDHISSQLQNEDLTDSEDTSDEEDETLVPDEENDLTDEDAEDESDSSDEEVNNGGL